ncbi:MAG: GNAT family N-acetyltransferase [Candidatus Hodarchaeota archaeon]
MVEKGSILQDLTIEVAGIKDAQGIYETLMENLIEVKDISKLSREEKEKLEERGFLRKEVKKEYYEDLIKNPKSFIYVAKEPSGKIVGFASIHKGKYDVRNFRSTLKNLYVDDEKIKDLLTGEGTEFAYLDQVSIIPAFKRKGVGKKIMEAIYKDINIPIVSFIVIKPLANMASARWHEGVGFDLDAKCDGEYKGEFFEWWIYIKHT